MNMQSSLDDIRKLTQILQDKDIDYSDTTSTDSDEFIEDSDFLDTDDNLINKCTDPVLKNALKCNMKKRKVLNELVDKLENHLAKLKHAYKECRIKIISDSRRTKKQNNLIRKRLGVPYFKDKNAFPSPVNADWHKMKERNHLLQSNYLLQNIWTQDDKYKLTKGVCSSIFTSRLTEIISEIPSIYDNANMGDKNVTNKIKLLNHEREVLSNSDLIEHLIKKWQQVNWKPKCDYSGTDQTLKDEQLVVEIVCNWKKNIDWLQISTQYFQRRHTDVECEAMWNCYASPKYSKESWTETDNKLLTDLCEKYNYQNWDAIASELNNQRSAYQCCVHFHAKLCEKFNRDKWTPEEDKYLQSVVEACSVGNYISWSKVAYYFKHRTKKQIYRHYINCTTQKIKKGNFSIEEDILLQTLMKTYNNNIKIIKTYFLNRSGDQLRNRMKTLEATDTRRPWSIYDDSKIIAFVAKHGNKDWTKLTEAINRSSGCIRHRYKHIQRWLKVHPNSSLYDLPRREGGKYRANIRKRQKIVRKVSNFLLEKLENPCNKAKILNINYIEEIMAPFLETSKRCYTKPERSTKDINIHNIMSDFFKSSYKCIIRTSTKVTNNYINDSADRIDILLNMLGANLVFPNVDKINNHPMLDEVDKLIITRMIQKRQEPTQSTSHHQDIISSSTLKCIPPSVETLIGLRGLLLQSTILKAHSHGHYMGYNLYVKHGPHAKYPENRYTYHKAQLEGMFTKRDENTKQILARREQLFFKRLKLLFQWPLIIADTKAEPICEVLNDNASDVDKEILKRGRKKREVKNYKITLMNEARRKKPEEIPEKRSSVHISEVTDGNPAKKQKKSR